MPRPRTINAPLLRKIRARILACSHRFDMRDFGGKNASKEKCGTVCCIAGHAMSQQYHNTHSACEICDAATKKLRLNYHQQDRLFYVGGWPDKFLIAFDNARSDLARAKVAARRITHFIRTKGEE